MKREILCEPCDRKRIASMGIPIVDTDRGLRLAMPIGPPEHHHSMRGKSTRELCCDHCGEHIHRGDPATAVSTWLLDGSYYEWEHNYITREEKPINAS